MFVIINQWTKGINAVHPNGEPEYWDKGTQFGEDYPDWQYDDDVVKTPNGSMPFLKALMVRTGAFTYNRETRVLHHDDTWQEDIP